jgi:hypothetical protein
VREVPGSGPCFRDGRLRNRQAQLQQLTVNPRRTPKRIGDRHRSNEHADLVSYRRPTSPVAALPRPEQSEPSQMPRDDRFWFDEHAPSATGPRLVKARPRAAGRSASADLDALGTVQARGAGAENLELQGYARVGTISKRHQEGDEDGHRSEGYSSSAATAMISIRTTFMVGTRSK